VSARYRVDLASGGHVEVSIRADVFALDAADRALVFELVDLLKEHGQPEREAPAKPSASPKPAATTPAKSNGRRPRREWTDEMKRKAVQRSYEVGSTVAGEEHDAHSALIRKWRVEFPDLGPIERRPFDPDAARSRAADALRPSD
jgi:hypothetical protein